MAKQILNVPPFPPLEWDEFFWTGEIVLESWTGFQTRRGSYASVSSDDESDGSVRLDISTNNDEPAPLTPEQISAFQFLLDNERAVCDSVLKVIFAEYPRLRKVYEGYFDDEEREKLLPAIERPEQLRTLIGLSNIHVLTVDSGGVAYIGFEFGCTWDGEHGLGVMTHQDRVIEIGQADTSFDVWAAKGDAGSKP